MVILRKPNEKDLSSVKALYQRSASIHFPWTSAPKNFEAYLAQEGRYFLCLEETGEIVGTFNVSNIVRDYFQSAYLGYEVFFPYQGKGLMRKGLDLFIHEAFNSLNLHRLEANIQPENHTSIKLVSMAGFVKEGFSKNYLNIGGEGWKDHERWALVNERWQENDL